MFILFGVSRFFNASLKDRWLHVRFMGTLITWILF
jgi:hypothetical protein